MKGQGERDPAILTCENWMTRNVQTVESHESVGHARELLRKHHINQLAIVKDGKLVGMVTDRDLRTKEHVPQSSHEIPLAMVMHHEVATLEPHSTLIEAATVLRHKQLDSVPIVTKGQLVGIVTRSDILDAFIAREKHGSGPANA